jgi:hypothetical protein
LGTNAQPEGQRAGRSGADHRGAGGALLQPFTDGYVEAWTVDVGVFVAVLADRSLTDAAVAQLHGVNHLAAAYELGKPLPPPDFSRC